MSSQGHSAQNQVQWSSNDLTVHDPVFNPADVQLGDITHYDDYNMMSDEWIWNTEGLEFDQSNMNTFTHSPPHGYTIYASPQSLLAASIAPSFLPNSHPDHHPDIVFVTSDNVSFYVCTALILSRSPHAFETILRSPLAGFQDQTKLYIDVPSDEFNVILHAVYNTYPQTVGYSPSLDTLIKAIDRMVLLDMAPKEYIGPSSPVYSLLVAYAPLQPMTMYCLAGRHHIEQLGILCSSYILSGSFSLFDITDAQASSMGAIALKKLFSLYQGRLQSLRKILFKAPEFHEELETCSFESQRALSRAWVMAIGGILWDAPADISSSTLQERLGSLVDVVSCKKCAQAIQTRVKEVLVQWMEVKIA